MDITTSKNIAFATFTFLPVVMFALAVTLGNWVFSFFRRKPLSYRHIWRSCWIYILLQVGFILLVLLLGFIELITIPIYFGGFLVLFGSTLLAIICFIYLIFKSIGKNA